VDTRIDICIDMCVDMCIDMCMDMCMDMCIDMCMDMCIDMCIDMCMDTCVDMCMDMYIDTTCSNSDGRRNALEPAHPRMHAHGVRVGKGHGVKGVGPGAGFSSDGGTTARDQIVDLS
jgi:hypothetical protein